MTTLIIALTAAVLGGAGGFGLGAWRQARRQQIETIDLLLQTILDLAPPDRPRPHLRPVPGGRS